MAFPLERSFVPVGTLVLNPALDSSEGRSPGLPAALRLGGTLLCVAEQAVVRHAIDEGKAEIELLVIDLLGVLMHRNDLELPAEIRRDLSLAGSIELQQALFAILDNQIDVARAMGTERSRSNSVLKVGGHRELVAAIRAKRMTFQAALAEARRSGVETAASSILKSLETRATDHWLTGQELFSVLYESNLPLHTVDHPNLSGIESNVIADASVFISDDTALRSIFTRVGVSFASLAELRRKALIHPDLNMRLAHDRALESVTSRLAPLQADANIRMTWGWLAARRDAQGIAEDQPESIWVAATAIAHECAVLTRTPNRYEGLNVRTVVLSNTLLSDTEREARVIDSVKRIRRDLGGDDA